jgi:hypothetical protein
MQQKVHSPLKVAPASEIIYQFLMSIINWFKIAVKNLYFEGNKSAPAPIDDILSLYIFALHVFHDIIYEAENALCNIK